MRDPNNVTGALVLWLFSSLQLHAQQALSVWEGRWPWAVPGLPGLQTPLKREYFLMVLRIRPSRADAVSSSKPSKNFSFSFKLVIVRRVSDPGSKCLLLECTPGLLVSRGGLFILLVRVQVLYSKENTQFLTEPLTLGVHKTPRQATRQVTMKVQDPKDFSVLFWSHSVSFAGNSQELNMG